MKSANYKIIFKGEICSDHDPEKVKQDIGLLFKLDNNKLTKIFSGIKVTLKKDITHEQAQKYQNKLKSLGLIVYLEKEKMAFSIVEDAPEEPSVMSPIYQPSSSSPQAFSRAQDNIHDPYVSRAQDNIHDPYVSRSEFEEIPDCFAFDFSGRIGRLTFINYIILTYLPISFIGIFAAFSPLLGGLLLLIYALVYCVLLFRICIFRLHDANLTGWLSVLMVIPLLNSVFLIFLAVLPGSAKMNTYGKPVKRGSFFGLIVCVILPFLLGILAAIMLPMYQDYVIKSQVYLAYQDLSIVKNEVDIALQEGKTPVIGTKTTNPNEYYPIGMAKGNVTKSSSKQANIRYAATVGLNNTDNNIKIYAVFNEQIPYFSGVTISLDRQADGVWNCIVYSNKQTNFKTKYLPKYCRMGN